MWNKELNWIEYPIYEWTNTNSWVKKQTPSRTKPKRNFKFEYFDFSIHKDIRKMLRTAVINYIKMKICYDTCFIDIGVAMATQWRHFVFNLPLYFLVPGVFSEIITVQFLIRRGRWIKAPKTYLYRVSLEPVREQGWGGGGSTRLPPTMWSGSGAHQIWWAPVWDQIPALTSNVGWDCCWFSPLLREVSFRILRFSPLLKNQHFQILILSRTHRHV